jgi:uncharacterized protein with gpF-like domain
VKYYQYSAIDDERTRPTHAAMDGKIFPRNHPIWDTWWPPNGYNCRCTVVAVTNFEAAEVKDQVERKWPEYTDPRSGETDRLLPDPGFGAPAG